MFLITVAGDAAADIKLHTIRLVLLVSGVASRPVLSLVQCLAKSWPCVQLYLDILTIQTKSLLDFSMEEVGVVENSASATAP